MSFDGDEERPPPLPRRQDVFSEGEEEPPLPPRRDLGETSVNLGRQNVVESQNNGLMSQESVKMESDEAGERPPPLPRRQDVLSEGEEEPPVPPRRDLGETSVKLNKEEISLEDEAVEEPLKKAPMKFERTISNAGPVVYTDGEQPEHEFLPVITAKNNKTIEKKERRMKKKRELAEVLDKKKEPKSWESEEVEIAEYKKENADSDYDKFRFNGNSEEKPLKATDRVKQVMYGMFDPFFEDTKPMRQVNNVEETKPNLDPKDRMTPAEPFELEPETIKTEFAVFKNSVDKTREVIKMQFDQEGRDFAEYERVGALKRREKLKQVSSGDPHRRCLYGFCWCCILIVVVAVYLLFAKPTGLWPFGIEGDLGSSDGVIPGPTNNGTTLAPSTENNGEPTPNPSPQPTVQDSTLSPTEVPTTTEVTPAPTIDDTTPSPTTKEPTRSPTPLPTPFVSAVRSQLSCSEIRDQSGINSGDFPDFDYEGETICGDSFGGDGSEPFDSGDCPSLTFSEAKAACEQYGARLCSREELLARVGWGTGCNSNHVPLYTYSECETDGGAGGQWKVTMGQGLDECETDLGAQYRVRCCGDTF